MTEELPRESERISRFGREREPRWGRIVGGKSVKIFSLLSLSLIEEKKNCCEGRCKCFNRARSWEDSTVQAFPLFRLESCHFAVCGGKFFCDFVRLTLLMLLFLNIFQELWLYLVSLFVVVCWVLFADTEKCGGCESVLVIKQMKNWKKK